MSAVSEKRKLLFAHTSANENGLSENIDKTEQSFEEGVTRLSNYMKSALYKRTI